MDLLSKRYASPCFFMDGAIQCGSFFDFVCDFLNTVAEENEEQTAWEFYLHKVFEGTFADFINSIKEEKALKNMPAKTIETTVQESLAILKNFKPD